MQLKIMHKEKLNLGEIFREDFKSPFHVTQNGGTINGNPAINNSYDGDGSGDYIRYDHFHWNQMQDFTLVIDVKRLDSVTSQAFVSGSTATTPLVRLISGSTLQFFISQSVSPIQKGVSKSIGDPLFAVMTYDYSTDAADFWIDGAAQSGGTFVSGLSSAAGVLDIAGRLGGVDSLDGEMGSVRIFNRILNDNEIEDLYNNATFVELKRPVAHYAFQDKKGTSTFTTTDLSSNGNDANVNGNPVKLAGVNGYTLDGTGDDFDAVCNAIQGTSQPWALGMWFKPTTMTTGVNGCLAHLTDASGNRIFTVITYQTGSDNILVNRSTIGLGNSAECNTVLKDGNIYHLLIAFDGSTPAPTVYINGEDDTKTATNQLGEDDDNDVLYIGSRKGAVNYTGDIYSVKIWDTFVTPIQAKIEYSKGYRYLGNR